ncbi:Translin family-domain-containing protein [Endogone sp. FLAS-F59071]|nr:Translin family-domain-containing protein [Endogone sp. FLAS-F59071]|eukprot:RUS19233.1 Translin family-domain-containing protein [Endogone sp. FLAS-F59071]
MRFLHSMTRKKEFLQAKNSNAVLNEAKNKKKDILALFQAVSVEATSFLHYLEHKELVAKEQVEKDFRDAEGRSFLQVTEEDYIFGIADLTGELMRLAINSVGNGNHEQALEVCQFLRSLKGDSGEGSRLERREVYNSQTLHKILTSTEYGIITVTQKSQLGRKLEVMKSSLIKVEDACYAIRIRGSEYPPEMYQDIIRSHQARYDEGEGGEAVYGDD